MDKRVKNNSIMAEKVWEDFRHNMSAALYLITEQQALIGKLLEELVRIGALNNEALSRVTDSKADPESLSGIYEELYKRYSGYVFLSKNITEDVEGKSK